MAEGWPEVLEKGEDVAVVLDWVRRKTKGRALIGVMIGANGVAVSVDKDLAPRDAIDLLRSQVTTIESILHELKQKRVTRGAGRRRD